jgi:hypothetical protein
VPIGVRFGVKAATKGVFQQPGVFSEDEMRRPTPHTQYPKGSANVRRALTPTMEGGSALDMDGSKVQPKMTAGLDLGDRYSYLLCLIDTESGEVIEEGRLRTTPEAFGRRFASERPMRVARSRLGPTRRGLAGC